MSDNKLHPSTSSAPTLSKVKLARLITAPQSIPELTTDRTLNSQKSPDVASMTYGPYGLTVVTKKGVKVLIPPSNLEFVVFE